MVHWMRLGRPVYRALSILFKKTRCRHVDTIRELITRHLHLQLRLDVLDRVNTAVLRCSVIRFFFRDIYAFS